MYMAKNYYRSDSNNLTCDVCGIKVKADETRPRWDGFQVCHGCWEERQPQDFVRARSDKISVPVIRPQAPLAFSIPVGYQDMLPIQSIFSSIFVLAQKDIQESAPVSENFLIRKQLTTADIITVQDEYSYIFGAVLTPTDAVMSSETGAICYLDYVESTYFSELYVGTCTLFPALEFNEAVSLLDTGNIVGDPYIGEDYFAELYVGNFVIFNP